MNAKGMKPIATETVTHYTTKMSYNGTALEYLGMANIGTATTADGWQIKKFVYDGATLTDILFAEGSDKFDKIWDNRITYSYS